MSAPVNTGGSAFPVGDFPEAFTEFGMTLRDWFAGQVLNGMHSLDMNDYPNMLIEMADVAYAQADAMIKARGL